ncbi:MAG: peptidoglycan-binding protein LysM [Bacteroidales bacterium]|nr:peptidoglycan-binding protein LysM [Bacteroidales bacterium]
MGLISFIKAAGEKIFGKSEEKKEQEKAALIATHIKKFGFDTNDIRVSVDNEKVILKGTIDTLDNKNKIIVTAGNIEGISAVEDDIFVRQPAVTPPPTPEKQFYTVKKGDYLSKIAKEVYGNAGKYKNIFEANKPMLKDPDLIYPGQVLVIPPLDK